MGMFYSILFLIGAFYSYAFLYEYFRWSRNDVVFSIRQDFINDDELYPAAFRALPSYSDMVHDRKYKHLRTKDQWVKWVKAQGVAA